MHRLIIVLFCTSPLIGTSDPAEQPPPLERPPSQAYAIVEHERTRAEKEYQDILKRQAQLKLRSSFIEAAKEGKPLTAYLGMKLDVNAQDEDGKTALIYTVLRYAQSSEQTRKTELFAIIKNLLEKDARPFGIRDRHGKNAWDYAGNDKDLQSLMMKMQTNDYKRRTSVDETMKKVFEIYKPQEEKLSK